MNRRIVVSCILILMLFSLTSCSEKKKAQEERSIQGKQSYILIANKNASEDEIESDVKIIKDRLHTIFKANEYALETICQGQYRLTIDSSKIWTMDDEEFLEYYVVEKGRLVIAHYESLYQKLIELEKDDYEITDYGDGFPEHILWTDGTELEEEENYRYLSIHFSDDLCKKIQKYEEFFESEIALRWDDYEEGYDTNSCILSGLLHHDKENPNLFYMVYEREDDFMEGHEQEFISIMSMPYLNHSFSYYRDSEENLHWQKVEESDYSGSFQCNVGEFENNYYTFVYSAYQRLASDEKSNLERIIKSRLDFRGEKYAIAFAQDGSLLVRTSGDKWNQWLARYLTSLDPYRKTLTDGLNDVSFDVHEQLEYDEKRGVLILHLQNTKEIGELSQVDNVYLKLNEIPVAQGKIRDGLDMNTLTFDQLILSGNPKKAEEDEWLLHYLLDYDISTQSQDVSNLHRYLVNYYYTGTDSRRFYNDVSHFSFPENFCYREDILEENIKKICPQATVQTDLINERITVFLHQKPEKGFIKQSMNMVANIYEQIDFGKSVYTHLSFELYDTEKFERAEVEFSKDQAYTDDYLEVIDVIHNYIYFGNGRSQDYLKEMREYLEKDTFFNQFERDIYGESWHLGMEVSQ